MAIRNSEQKASLPPDVAEAVGNVAKATGIIHEGNGTYFVVMRRTESGVATEMLHPFYGTLGEERELIRKLQLHLANFRKRQRKTTPVVVRRVDEDSPFSGLIEGGDYYESVADFNEDLQLDRHDTTTHRALQRALNRNKTANIGGVHASFATVEEVKRAEERLRQIA